MNIGKLLGFLAALAYFGSLMNLVTKRLNQYLVRRKSKIKLDKRLIQLFVRYHRFWGIAAAGFVLLHFVVQYTRYGFISRTGMTAALLMLLQASLGCFGQYIQKKRPGLWLNVHRLVAIALLIAIGFHVA